MTVPYYEHIWLAGHPDALCPPVSIGYAGETAYPSTGDYTDPTLLFDDDTGTWIDVKIDTSGVGDTWSSVRNAMQQVALGVLNPPEDALLVAYFRADEDFDLKFKPSPSGVPRASFTSIIGETTSLPAPHIGEGWREASPLQFADGYDHASIVTLFQGSANWTLEVEPPKLEAGDPTSYPDRRTRVYDLLVSYRTLVARDAPPCRLLPREDGLGVGGGRHFPPAKSQQRSGRRFGYY